MTLEELKTKNPGLPLYGTDSAEFAMYGRRVSGIDVTPLIKAGEAVEFPAQGSTYVATLPAFEELPVSGQIADLLFGTLPTQTGYCYGHNEFLNGLEWHSASEVNIAVTDLVLILGLRQEWKNGKIDSSALKAFYLKKGEIVEIYATSLHFCPCEVEEGGFGCVVCLPSGTNLPLEKRVSDPYLFRQNKWLIAHEQNAGLIARGVVAGITGENLRICR